MMYTTSTTVPRLRNRGENNSYDSFYRNIMIDEKLYLTDGSLFATKYNRVVHGQRGDYIELEKDHIVPELVSKFNNDLNETYDFYYLWLHPIDKSQYKVYYQLKTVKYADYKIGKYYISPEFIKDYKDPECLF